MTPLIAQTQDFTTDAPSPSFLREKFLTRVSPSFDMINLYDYVGNRVNVFVDPLGLRRFPELDEPQDPKTVGCDEINVSFVGYGVNTTRANLFDLHTGSTPVSSVDDLIKKAQSLVANCKGESRKCCCCINEFEFKGHGQPGMMSVGAGNHADPSCHGCGAKSPPSSSRTTF